MNKNLIPLAMLLVVFAVGSEMPMGCSGTISGNVTDGSNPIEGVQMSATRTDIVDVEISPTTTNSNGVYSFAELAPGTYSVTATTGSYSKTQSVTLDDSRDASGCAGQTLDFTFSLLGLSESMISNWTMDVSTGTSTWSWR